MAKDNGPGLLVADDDPMVLSTMRDILEMFGFRVFTAEDGEDAVTLFRSHGPEIGMAVLDYAMPRMNGERAFHELRKIRPDLPVLFCTGCMDPDAEERLARERVSVLMKPVRPGVLVAKIELGLGQTSDAVEPR